MTLKVAGCWCQAACLNISIFFPQTTKPEFTDNYPEKRKYPDDFLIKAEYHLSIVANLLLAASS